MYIEYYDCGSVFFNNGCSCYLSNCGNFFALWSLKTQPNLRNQGFAKLLLENVKYHSESTGIPVRLVASPFDDCPFSLEQLKEFYSKNGFINTDRDEFYYYPKGEGNE